MAAHMRASTVAVSGPIFHSINDSHGYVKSDG